jgi:hypothetical protein
MKYMISMPDGWDGECCGFCCECPLLRIIRKRLKNNRAECPLAIAKPAVEVKLDIDHETGLSVIDEKGVFHFEGQDRYYAVKEEK